MQPDCVDQGQLIADLEQRLLDQFTQSWQHELSVTMGKLRTYKMIKEHFRPEKYLELSPHLIRLSMLAPTPPPLPGEVRQKSSAIDGSGVVNATIRLLSQTVTKNYSPYVFNKNNSHETIARTNTEARNTRIDGQTEYSSTDTARCALGWHVMALHCARELFVLRMRTLAIQYPDPWGKSAIPNKENSPPYPW